jgi:hypothetical protein
MEFVPGAGAEAKYQFWNRSKGWSWISKFDKLTSPIKQIDLISLLDNHFKNTLFLRQLSDAFRI